MDNSVHSDLDPLEAPEWSISISLLDKPECLLAKHVGGGELPEVFTRGERYIMYLGEGGLASNLGEVKQVKTHFIEISIRNINYYVLNGF